MKENIAMKIDERKTVGREKKKKQRDERENYCVGDERKRKLRWKRKKKQQREIREK